MADTDERDAHGRFGTGRRPWLQKRADETEAEYQHRTNHSCYWCGEFREDLNELDEHERAHHE